MIQPHEWSAGSMGLMAMVTREDGSLRWPVIIGGIITASVVSMGAGLLSLVSDISAIRARQEIVLKRLDALEASAHPATSKRFNADDAHALELRIDRRLERLEDSINGK